MNTKGKVLSQYPNTQSYLPSGAAVLQKREALLKLVNVTGESSKKDLAIAAFDT